MKENEFPKEHTGEASHLSREDEGDNLKACLRYLRKSLQGDRKAPWSPSFSREEKSLAEWARSVGLLIEDLSYLSQFKRGGQEHDIFEAGERIFKITKNGIFGLKAGIDLALVSSDQDARRFHLWEATPYQYLERLALQNQLVPSLNKLEGVIKPSVNEIAIITSQPLLKIEPVTVSEIDKWFSDLAFRKIANSAYYREEDNLGIFDAHDKNLVRNGNTLIPFDVIPCHPDGGFLSFIQDSLKAGHTLTSVRSTTLT